jgi:hypothetical protein
MRGFVALMLALAPIAAAHATDDDLRSVSGMTGRVRVLLAFAPSLQDARMTQQRAEMARFAIGAAQRDLMFVQVDLAHVIGATDQASQLRTHFQIAPNAYHTLLIDKDGKIALSVDGPLPADRIALAIDSLQSRQQEVKRAKAGRPVAANP